MREAIRFLRGDQIIELSDVAPTETLLDYLRLSERKVGTKEGCNEGDCGACTVALGRLVDGQLVYEPVNACIQLLGQVDGCEVVTIEDLAEDGRLHPVQEALARHHGSQCGFCTPGIAMSLFTLYHQPAAAPDRRAVNEALAGNLCRCTGYRPIADAALEVCFVEPDDQFSRRADQIAETLAGLHDGEEIFIGDETSFFAAPASIDALADLYSRHPDATLVAGATDVGLWITKQLRDLPKIIWLGRVAFLDRVEAIEEGLIIGATASLAHVEPEIARLDPDLGAVWSRIGSRQVRASGTVGGNIANGSPIGDTPPMLIALGAMLELRKGETARTLPLEDFFIDYGKQDRGEAEFVTGIFVPAPGPERRLPRLQDLQALRSGHLRRDGRLPVHHRGGTHYPCARRLRRHGRDAEAGAAGRSRAWWGGAGRARHLGPRAEGHRTRFRADIRHARERGIPGEGLPFAAGQGAGGSRRHAFRQNPRSGTQGGGGNPCLT